MVALLQGLGRSRRGVRLTASPAQVANDLAAQADFYARRDNRIADACRDCARIIRALLAKELVDGRTYSGLYGRLLDLTLQHRNRAETQIATSLHRGLVTLTTLRSESRR